MVESAREASIRGPLRGLLADYWPVVTAAVVKAGVVSVSIKL